MCYFPNIDYTNDFNELPNDEGNQLPPGPRGLFNLLQNKGIVEPVI